MRTIRGTQTEKNILTAFAGESQARNRYTFFASRARKEGLILIASIFEETADQEKEHAKRLFMLLEGGGVDISATFPAGTIGTTAENLRAAASGENHEQMEIYPGFAQMARHEGFESIATIFEALAVAERHHEGRYRSFLSNLEEGTLFSKEKAVAWHCRNCGFLHDGVEAPEECPACAHPRGYFEPFGEEERQ